MNRRNETYTVVLITILMSIWLPRQGHALIARTCSRSIYSYRSHIILQNKSQFYQPRTLSLFRCQSTNSNQPQTQSVPNPAHDHEKSSLPTLKESAPLPLTNRIWKKVRHEVQHYWHGTKLLVSEVRIASKLQWKILHGETLTRRERRQVCVLSFLLSVYSVESWIAETYHSRFASPYTVLCFHHCTVHGIPPTRCIKTLP
jgi:hypothetical protein